MCVFVCVHTDTFTHQQTKLTPPILAHSWTLTLSAGSCACFLGQKVRDQGHMVINLQNRFWSAVTLLAEVSPLNYNICWNRIWDTYLWPWRSARLNIHMFSHSDSQPVKLGPPFTHYTWKASLSCRCADDIGWLNFLTHPRFCWSPFGKFGVPCATNSWHSCWLHIVSPMSQFALVKVVSYPLIGKIRTIDDTEWNQSTS